MGASCKTLRIPLRMDTRVCELDSLDLLAPGSVPSDMTGLIGPYAEQWQGLGFVHLFDYTVPPVSPGMRSCASVLLSLDAQTLAEVVFVEKAAGAILRRELASWCMSCFPDGRRMGVTSLRRRMDGPAQFEMAYLTGRPPAELYAAHQRRLAVLSAGSPLPLDAGCAQRVLVENNNLSVRFMAGRGVYVDPTAEAASPIVPR